MLSGFDEIMCHQLSTMDHVHTDNPEWTERIYVSVYNVRDKDTVIGSVWPIPRQERSGWIRHRVASRKTVRSRLAYAAPEGDEVKIGPLSVEVLEGLRRFRMRLGDNPSSLRLDLEWIASMNPHEEEHDFRQSSGKVVQDISRFDQVGRVAQV